MRCWNCHKRIPKGAQVCEFCEAAVQADPTPEEMEVLRGILDELPEDALNELHELMQQSDTAEEFVNRIFVGDCPKCSSSDTGDCENDPEIDDVVVGRCYQCGHMWCTLCDQALDPKSPQCPCWDEEEEEE